MAERASWGELALLEHNGGSPRRTTASCGSHRFGHGEGPGVPPAWAEGDETLSTTEDVLACVSHPGPLEPVAGSRYAVALHVGIRVDNTVAVVAHAKPVTAGRRVVVDRLVVWKPSRAERVRLQVEVALLGLLRERAIGLPDDPELVEELASVRIVWRRDRGCCASTTLLQPQFK